MQPVNLQGTIKRFKGDGRRLGYPTANLNVVTDLADGIYFGFADLAAWKHQPAMIFVGTPITMGETTRRVEAHLLDIPDQDYYDQSLSLHIEHFYRPNQTLADVDELKMIMKDDEQQARRWFASSY